MSEKPASRYLNSTDVSRLCEVDNKTVHIWVERGLLRCFRTPGGHLRFHRDELQAFMRDKGFLRPWESIPEAAVVSKKPANSQAGERMAK